MNAEPVVYDRVLAPRTHPARGHRVVDGLDVLPHITLEVGVRERLVSVAAQHLVGDELDVKLPELVGLFHTLEKLHALDQSADVIGVVEEVGVDDRMVMDAGAAQYHRSLALGSQQSRIQSESLGKEVVFKEVRPDCVVPIEDVFYARAAVTSKVKGGLNNLQI